MGYEGGRKDRNVWRSSPWLLPLETLNTSSFGLLQVAMVLILIGIEGYFGMSCLVFSVGGTCLVVLGVTLMLPDSPDWKLPTYAQL